MPKSAGKEFKAGTRGQFWFLSLTFAVSYSILAMREGFSSEYVVQEDARQHVVWMLRYLDPELFPNDLIADYFQSVAPVGYASLYRLAATAGIDPLLFNKLLPPILGLITSGYCFSFCMQILPVPVAGFFATLLLNQNLWMKDDLASATPRAFAYPLLLAFLYYLSRRSLCCGAAIALTGLFYPQCVFLEAGVCVLQLFRWQDGRISVKSPNIRFCAIVLFVAFVVMLPYAVATSKFGPTITAAQAKQLPEFLSGGRSAFFEEFGSFWFFGGRSGILPELLLTPLTLLAGFFLPLLLNLVRFPLAKNIKPAIWLLPQLLLVSISLFFIAHAFLFKLHLPNRYTSYSLRIVLALAAGIALTVVIDILFKAGQARLSAWMQTTAFLLVALIWFAIIFYPSFLGGQFPKTKYITGHAPRLYEFLQAQPQDIAIASLVEEANNIPAFAQRTVLVAPEFAIPYHLGYYLPFRERVLDLIQAQYSLEFAQVNNFIQKYGVDYWLLDKSAFTPKYLEKNPWLQQYQPATAAAIENLHTGTPALASFLNHCSVFAEDDLVVLSAKCIVFK